MRIPPGYRVNPSYAAHSACPHCGSMLRVLSHPAATVLRAPAAPDDERVVRCRDCERALDGATCGTWCMEHHRYVDPRDFCAWGKERDGE